MPRSRVKEEAGKEDSGDENPVNKAPVLKREVDLVLVINHPQERSILEKAFKALSAGVHVSPPGMGTYIKTLQYLPDCMVVEYPGPQNQTRQMITLLQKLKLEWHDSM